MAAISSDTMAGAAGTEEDMAVKHEEAAAVSPEPFDVYALRKDFPILERTVHGKPIVYLDNAATSQTPVQVVDTIRNYYLNENSNVHRGVHFLSQTATDKYEATRHKIGKFLNPPVGCEIIFTKGTTDGINLVAQTYGRQHVEEGDEVLVSTMEHHSNIVPWQMLCEEKGAKLRAIPLTDRGEIDMEAYEAMLTDRVKIVGVVHVSNALGTVNPVKEMIAMAHDRGIPVLLDGAQSAPHMRIDLKDLGADFFACSGHKMYGPTGIGVLHGRANVLNKMPPYQGGGDMIMSVTFEKTRFNSLPYKFEAGTPNIEGVIAMGTVIDYLENLGMDRIAAHEQELLVYGTEALRDVAGLKIIGTADKKAGVISFTMESAHPHDIGQICDDEGVAIRVGHHCAQPVMAHFGIPATARASFAAYNTKEDVDALVRALHKVNKVFG